MQAILSTPGFNTAPFKPCDNPGTMETCGNCGERGIASSCVKFCHSCANTVCNMCMVQEEGCCLLCLDTFPESPSMRISSQRNVTGTNFFAPACLQPESPPWEQEKFCFNNEYLLPGEFQECPAPLATRPHAFSGSTLASEHIDESGSSTVSVSASTDGDLDGSIEVKEEATTMMIRNIPCRLSQNEVVEAIHSFGFADTYDFVYLPGRGGRGRGNTNIGYAFVNFKSAQVAERFGEVFENYKFPGTASSKRCTVSHAHFQGFNAALIFRARGKR